MDYALLHTKVRLPGTSCHWPVDMLGVSIPVFQVSTQDLSVLFRPTNLLRLSLLFFHLSHWWNDVCLCVCVCVFYKRERQTIMERQTQTQTHKQTNKTEHSERGNRTQWEIPRTRRPHVERNRRLFSAPVNRPHSSPELPQDYHIIMSPFTLILKTLHLLKRPFGVERPTQSTAIQTLVAQDLVACHRPLKFFSQQGQGAWLFSSLSTELSPL